MHKLYVYHANMSVYVSYNHLRAQVYMNSCVCCYAYKYKYAVICSNECLNICIHIDIMTLCA